MTQHVPSENPSTGAELESKRKKPSKKKVPVALPTAAERGTVVDPAPEVPLRSHGRGRESLHPTLRKPQEPGHNSYLKAPEYRTTSLRKLLSLDDAGARQFIAKVLWGKHGEDVQVCPECGSIHQQYWCASLARKLHELRIGGLVPRRVVIGISPPMPTEDRRCQSVRTTRSTSDA